MHSSDTSRSASSSARTTRRGARIQPRLRTELQSSDRFERLLEHVDGIHGLTGQLAEPSADTVQLSLPSVAGQVPRYRYRKTDVQMNVYQPGGTCTQQLVITRDLSRDGIGSLCRPFLHVGSYVTFTLPLAVPQGQRDVDVLEGTVVRCNYVGLGFHDLGVAWDKALLPLLYMGQAA
ncbi:MAG: hypothetical protein QM770_04275 [Tepidisphaeraceae bacterium]